MKMNETLKANIQAYDIRKATSFYNSYGSDIGLKCGELHHDQRSGRGETRLACGDGYAGVSLGLRSPTLSYLDNARRFGAQDNWAYNSAIRKDSGCCVPIVSLSRASSLQADV
jgi:hypothetical protein